MAEWSARWTRNPVVPGSDYLDLFHGGPDYKFSATFVINQLVFLRPVGILNNIVFNLSYLFRLFARLL